MALGVIGALRAIIWLRWRLLLNSFRGRRQRDALESASRWLAVVVPILIAIFVLAWALLLAVGAVLGGVALARDEPASRAVRIFARLLPFMVSFVLVVAALGRSGRAAVSSGARMSLLPIPRRLLHHIEVAAGLGDPWILFMVPALLALPFGLWRGGLPSAGALALLAGLGLLAAMMGLSSLLSNALQWLMRERRRGEALAILLVVVASTFGLMIASIDDRIEGRVRAAKRPPGSAPAARVVRIDGLFPAWLRPLPSELYGSALDAAADRRAGRAAGISTLLLGEAALMIFLSGRIHRRLLETPAGGRRRRGGEVWPREVSLPGIDPVVTSLALAQARSWMRTVRGRMVLLLPGPMLLALGFVLGSKEAKPGALPAFLVGPIGPLILGFGLTITILSIQPMAFNQFAADRAGLTLMRLAPVEVRQVAAGKTLAGGLLFLAGALPCLAAALIARPGGPVLLWAATLLGAAGIYAASAPAATAISALFPRASDLGEIGSAGNPHPLAGLVGSLMTLVLAVPPGLLTFAGWILAESGILTFGLQAAWLGAAVGAAWLLSGPAAVVAARRLEAIGLAAQGR